MISFDAADRSCTRQGLEARRARQERLPLDYDPRSLQGNASLQQPERTSARLDLLVLGSGSKGNAAVVRDKETGEGILIDAGICKRDVFAFGEQGGFSFSHLKGIFITHSHSDHVKNLGVIVRGLKAQGIEVPLFMHPKMLAESTELKKAKKHPRSYS